MKLQVQTDSPAGFNPFFISSLKSLPICVHTVPVWPGCTGARRAQRTEGGFRSKGRVLTIASIYRGVLSARKSRQTLHKPFLLSLSKEFCCCCICLQYTVSTFLVEASTCTCLNFFIHSLSFLSFTLLPFLDHPIWELSIFLCPIIFHFALCLYFGFAHTWRTVWYLSLYVWFISLNMWS